MRDCAGCRSRLDGIFAGLKDPQLEVLSEHMESRVYKKGEILFSEGDSPRGIFCVSEAKLKLFKATPKNQKEVILRLFRGGDVIGYRNLLSGESYSANLEVTEAGRICFLDKSVFTRLIAEDPNLAFEMLAKFSRSLSEMEQRVCDLAGKTARQRLGELLLVLQKTYGKETEAGVFLDLSISRKDLASMINTTPETVIRTLSEMSKSGLLELEEKRITLKDVAALATDCLSKD